MKLARATAEKVYKEFGRVDGEAFLRATWKPELRGPKGAQYVEDMIDILHYIADMEEGKITA
jgi:hypothetical protein